MNGNDPESMSLSVRPFGGCEGLGEQQFHLADKVLGHMLIMSRTEIIRLENPAWGRVRTDLSVVRTDLSVTPAESG